MAVGENGKQVSRWADMGFKCCTDAKVILLSGELSGFTSYCLAELFFDSSTGRKVCADCRGKHSVPGQGRLCCCRQG